MENKNQFLDLGKFIEITNNKLLNMNQETVSLHLRTYNYDLLTTCTIIYSVKQTRLAL